jgi:hypothetical protein
VRRHPTRVAGWTFDALLLDDPPSYGGLALATVHHDFYNFARDIRVVRIWASSELPTPTQAPERSLLLGHPGQLKLETMSGFPIGLAAPGASYRLVADYRPSQEIFARFRTPGPLLEGSNGRLTVTQRYVFTRYGNYLSHEPSGELKAARLYPLLHFFYEGDPRSTTRLRYVRVDYRCELTVDRKWVRRAEASAARAFRDFAANQGGVFRDREPGPSVGGIARRGALGVFEAAEKPLLWEILGQGLVRGHKGDWDNYHQWGAQAETDLPVAPGTPHAAHTHWRWAPIFASTKPSATVPKGGRQYHGADIPGSPLVDPAIWDQSLRFAVTVTPPDPRAPAEWRAELNPSTHPFDGLFTQASAHPVEIKDGAQLAVWFSFEAFRSEPVQIGSFYQATDAPWSGTFFVHGFFFPHEPQPPPGSARFRGPIQPRDATRRWVRRPNS